MDSKFLEGYSMLAKTRISEGHKILCIMASLNIYVAYIILLNTCFWMKLFPLTMQKSKENIMDPLTKCLSRELMYSSSRGTRLKSLKMKECNDGNYT